MTVQEFLSEKASKTERALAAYLDTWEDAPESLRQAARYSLFAGGKRLRPALALGAADVIAGDDAVAIPAACAVEMIHTYSLIHDDLPAMDNDDLRRGKPTLHKAYGEALAILAGDALLTMAFDVLAETHHVRVIQEMAQAAGVAGMVGGQVMDMESAGKRLNPDALRQLHARKTGALIRVSVRGGAMLAGACDTALDALTTFGEQLGLAFQIADDILDVVGLEADLGKAVGGDAARAKATYPAILGIERARGLAEEAVETAVQALSFFGSEADPFRQLAHFVIDRRS